MASKKEKDQKGEARGFKERPQWRKEVEAHQKEKGGGKGLLEGKVGSPTVVEEEKGQKEGKSRQEAGAKGQKVEGEEGWGRARWKAKGQQEGVGDSQEEKGRL